MYLGLIFTAIILNIISGYLTLSNKKNSLDLWTIVDDMYVFSSKIVFYKSFLMKQAQIETFLVVW